MTEEERRHALSHHDQMEDAQSQCVSCSLCGGSAEIYDAGSGPGYFIHCSNGVTFDGDCLIGDNRIRGWAYNASELWNRLHVTARKEGEAHGMEKAAGELARLRAEIARLKRPTLFWIDEDPETGHCDPWEATESALYNSGDEGVVAIREGRELGVRYYARLRADDEADSDDDWLHDFDTEQLANEAIAAERARRTAIRSAINDL